QQRPLLRRADRWLDPVAGDHQRTEDLVFHSHYPSPMVRLPSGISMAPQQCQGRLTAALAHHECVEADGQARQRRPAHPGRMRLPRLSLEPTGTLPSDLTSGIEGAAAPPYEADPQRLGADRPPRPRRPRRIGYGLASLLAVTTLTGFVARSPRHDS